MFFDDASCLPESTLQLQRENGFSDVLEAEWSCIVSISFAGKVSVDASNNLKHLAEDKVYFTLLNNNKQKFLRARKPCIALSSEGYFLLRERIRSSTNYEVFYVAFRQTREFSQNEIQWVDLYFSKAYSNILLNHELFQQTEYIEGVFDSIEASVFILDIKLMIVTHNASAKKLLSKFDTGKERNYFLRDIPFSNLSMMESAIEYVITSGVKKYLSDVIISDLNGQDRIFYITLVPLRNSKKVIAGVVAVCTDITQFKMVQQEMNTLEQYGLLGEIALGMSHDVKNPLMNINSCVHLLQNGWNQDIDYKRYFSLILQETDRISITVDQLMSFGNISSEPMTYFVNVNEVLFTCAQIIERQKLSVRFRDITLDMNLCKDAPPVKARVFDLQQVFLNILINSLQSIDKTGAINISSQYNKKLQNINVIIADTGCGIDKAYMEELFLPYHSTKQNGKGLGLFLTKRTLERYKGKLEFSSQEGVGTVCTITLPVS